MSCQAYFHFFEYSTSSNIFCAMVNLLLVCRQFIFFRFNCQLQDSGSSDFRARLGKLCVSIFLRAIWGWKQILSYVPQWVLTNLLLWYTTSLLHSGKLTRQWKMTIWRCISYKEMVIFHCYVSLPGRVAGANPPSLWSGSSSSRWCWQVHVSVAKVYEVDPLF